MVIIQATTPTITYTFKEVDPADIAQAYLTIKQGGSTIIEKDLDDAAVGEDSLAFTFTQQETRLLAKGQASAMLNWKTNDGTRGASAKTAILIDDNYKNEVI